MKGGTGLNQLVERLLPAGVSEDEQLRALRDAFTARVPLPLDAHVIGEPVEVAYAGNARRGVTATCRRRDELYPVSLADVVFAEGTIAEDVAFDDFQRQEAGGARRR